MRSEKTKNVTIRPKIGNGKGGFRKVFSRQRYLERLAREIRQLEAKGRRDEWGTLYLIGPLF